MQTSNGSGPPWGARPVSLRARVCIRVCAPEERVHRKGRETDDESE